ncbi:tryptophan synthase subunit alpha [Pelolinea submarina]|uniref:tryptophan synthase n=1 Tax=Pelolinea submarina TaxID=913107 RepID=A0A347ZUD4_9CHLR|nr:tryptophan synthase subunit alpha [Pelolinea submarina]REG10499.1 tryptophan synthase alpha chain [Pelolinea submarina]BBB48915.1 tryptophan synthase alpha chain [Pelolinea submarina]
MNRIDKMFDDAKKKNEACLMTYLPSIGPDLSRSNELIDGFIESGLDYVELGTPGGVPWLDGTPMQKNHKQSLETGIDGEKAIFLGKQIRDRHADFPILPMLYTSVIVRMGVDNFVDLLLESDLDGVEIPDYASYRTNDPLGIHAKLRKKGIYNINFCDGISLAEEGSRNYELLRRIATDVDGFIFLTATPGVTGSTGGVNVPYLKEAVARIRAVQEKYGKVMPIMVGFGINTPEDIELVVNEVKADAVVVGSAVTRLIQSNTPIEKICDFIKSLKSATVK